MFKGENVDSNGMELEGHVISLKHMIKFVNISKHDASKTLRDHACALFIEKRSALGSLLSEP